jgi:hypothetical protein
VDAVHVSSNNLARWEAAAKIVIDAHVSSQLSYGIVHINQRLVACNLSVTAFHSAPCVSRSVVVSLSIMLPKSHACLPREFRGTGGVASPVVELTVRQSAHCRLAFDCPMCMWALQIQIQLTLQYCIVYESDETLCSPTPFVRAHTQLFSGMRLRPFSTDLKHLQSPGVAESG